MSSIDNKQHFSRQYSQSPSRLRFFALSAMASASIGVGLWRSHLLAVASLSDWLLFFAIIATAVMSVSLAGWAYQRSWESSQRSRTPLPEPQLDHSGKDLASKSKTRKAAAKVAAIAVMIGLGLLAILPIVALVKVSVVESMVKQKSEESVHFGSERFAKAFAQQYKRCLDEQR